VSGVFGVENGTVGVREGRVCVREGCICVGEWVFGVNPRLRWLKVLCTPK